LDCNKGSLGEFETAFDGEMEAIADIMEYVIDNQIPGNLTIHSDGQADISRVGNTVTCPAKTELSEWCGPYSAGSGKVGVRGLNGFQGILDLIDTRGPISSVVRQLHRADRGEDRLYGSKSGSHSIIQSQRILKLIKVKNLLLPQHRRNLSQVHAKDFCDRPTKMVG
jgi:hypothetical protein